MKRNKKKSGQKAKQIAALPVRWTEAGDAEVLLVTSRRTKRWVIPKGWTMNGKAPWQAAEIEASEEAGAKGEVANKPVGSYDYVKILDDGSGMICDVLVYPMHVSKLAREWKEDGERERRWFPAKRAAKLVQEPGLAAMLKKLRHQRKKEFLRAF